MTLLVYHQMGHNGVWNRDLLEKDQIGDGLIVSACHMSDKQIAKIPPITRRASLFDPQFFVPGTARSHLKDYDFYPLNIMGESFDTTEFETVALESAYRCVLFQNRNDFSHIVIPTRYLTGLPADFPESQMEFSVNPFLDAVEQERITKPVLLQIVMNHDMMKDEGFATRILNWITGIERLSGVYLIAERPWKPKQVQDTAYLLSLMEFIYSLQKARMQVVVGYTNTEAILLSAAMPTALTIGAYENTSTRPH